MEASRISRAILILATLACFITACALKRKVKAAKPARIGSTETGVASWYGDPYHGRHAANGEVYDMEKLTAAHRTLPFGTWVRVKNLTNDKTVDVRIQDRGPFIGHRIIDLSRAAAREIEMIGPGTVKVRLTVIAPSKAREPVVVVQAKLPQAKLPQTNLPQVTGTPVATPPASIEPAAPPPVEPDTELFAVQIGSFQDRSKAELLRASMNETYGPARIVIREGKQPLYRVLVGQEDSVEKAGALAERMRGDGSNGFVVRLDTASSAK
jgi:rare lipoprotein A